MAQQSLPKRPSPSKPSARAGADPLVGHWFHSFDDDGVLGYQGQVLAPLGDGYYLLQLYDFIVGLDSVRIVTHVGEMKRWRFYLSDAEMRDAYAQHPKHP